MATPAVNPPPEDRRLSPRTGWTRAHWEWLADRLLAGVHPYATKNHALVHLPGGRPSRNGERCDALEGFARTFLLAAFRLRGSGGIAPGELAERYTAGLVVGTNRDGSESWPPIGHHSQAAVEAASIAIGLYETRPWIWERLSSEERERVVGWLAGINRKRMYPNNWFLFPVIVNAFLKSVGAPHRQMEIDRNLDRIETMYRGRGWYVDGRRFDHYVGWAFHFYTLLWCRMDGDASDSARAAAYRERVRLYLEDYRHLFGANGAPLYQGRSLIYRWATLAPLWAASLLDASPLSPGEARRLASGVARYFHDAGALAGGVLSMGWHQEFLPMTQDYSGPASPYWASKGLLGLLLPSDHPVWTEVEQPLAVEQTDFCRAMPEPGWLAVGTVSDGVVRVFNKQGGARGKAPSPPDPHYDRLAYSTHTAPDLRSEGGAPWLDTYATLIRPGARRFRGLGGGGQLEVASRPWTGAEVRVHRVRANPGTSIRTGGFALADNEPLRIKRGVGWALVQRRDGLVSAVLGVQGFESAEVSEAVDANPFGRYSATPFLVGRRTTRTSVHVALIVLTGAPFDPAELLTRAEVLELDRAAIGLALSKKGWARRQVRRLRAWPLAPGDLVETQRTLVVVT